MKLFLIPFLLIQTVLAAAPAAPTIAPAMYLTPRQKQNITDNTVKALLEMARARKAIHDKDYLAAKADLASARVWFDVIRSELPTQTLRNRLAIAQEHLAFDNPQNVLPDLIPIYAELSFGDSVWPAAHVRKHLDSARDYLKKGNRAAAQNELKVVDDAVVFNEVDVPLSHTDELVNEALDKLKASLPASADKLLSQAELGLQSGVVAALNQTVDDVRKAE